MNNILFKGNFKIKFIEMTNNELQKHSLITINYSFDYIV
jgi:hypothetical protein